MTAPGSILRAGLLAGLVGALLQATPFLSAINSCCCAVIVVVGAFAAWMLRSDSAGAASSLRCGAAGSLAGIVAALLGVPLGALLSRLAHGAARLEGQLAEQMEALRRGMPQAPPPGMLEAWEAGLRATMGIDFSGWLIAATLGTAAVQAFFGLLGGLIGAALFRGAARPPGAFLASEASAVPTIGAPPPAVPPATMPSFAPTPAAPPAATPSFAPEPDVAPPAPPAPSPPSPPPVPPPSDLEPGEAPAEPEGGDIPLDELPLLPPRPEPEDEPGPDRR